jgi:hypothetical protein
MSFELAILRTAPTLVGLSLWLVCLSGDSVCLLPANSTAVLTAANCLAYQISADLCGCSNSGLSVVLGD